MKLRKGFVSNSSSSSFVAYGATLNTDEFIKLVSESGKIEIKFTENSDNVEIQFIDNGPGIPEENLSKIFEPLFTTKVRGVGLGLAISKRLADLNQAEITVESREKEGSEFTLWLKSA